MKDNVVWKAEVYEVNSPTASPVTSNQTPSPPGTSSLSESDDKSSVHSSQQGPLEAAPTELGAKCSSDNLRTVAGIAACREACAPAQCCQTNIGSAGCGYETCGSYGECNALVSIVDIGVPQGGHGEVDSDGGDAGDAGDGLDVGDGEDVGDIDDRGEGVEGVGGRVPARDAGAGR